MKKLIGWQIVSTDTDNPPKGMATHEVYPLDFVIEYMRKLSVKHKPDWRLLPIFDGDVEEPTFPRGERDALSNFVGTINGTGGVKYDGDPKVQRKGGPKGWLVPVADEDWIDLGTAYEQACDVLGVKLQKEK